MYYTQFRTKLQPKFNFFKIYQEVLFLPYTFSINITLDLCPAFFKNATIWIKLGVP